MEGLNREQQMWVAPWCTFHRCCTFPAMQLRDGIDPTQLTGCPDCEVYRDQTAVAELIEVLGAIPPDV